MGKKQKLRRPTTLSKHQPLLTEEKSRPVPRMKRRVGEVAGGTAAECAAVCCCCPCTVVNFLILAVYKVPAGLCRRAWKKKKRQIAAKKKGQTLLHQRPTSEYFQSESVTPSILEEEVSPSEEKDNDDEGSNDVVDLENEMWAKFYGAGFWRSTSQREK